MHIFQLSFSVGILVVGLAFCTEYIDSTLGMGYGTALTPVLLLLGFEPLIIVPAVLLSEFVTGILAAFAHSRAGNVVFLPKNFSFRGFHESVRKFGLKRVFRCGTPKALKVVMLLSLCSIGATVGAVFFAVKLPTIAVKLYIGVMILGYGYCHPSPYR